MSEEQRFLRLIEALTAGQEVAVTRADAVAIALAVTDGVDRATAARAEAIAARGERLACAPGCASCCEQIITAWGAEIELIVAWLREPEQVEILAAFLAAYPTWLAQTGDRLARVTAARDEA